MLLDLKACLKVALIALLVSSMFGVTALAASSNGVQVVRIINGSSSSATPGYQAGDTFTAELDYTVTGTQFLVTVNETLPSGWKILNSTVPYALNSGTNTYCWNVTSPLNGVRDGKILYLVQIPDNAATGSYKIDGWSEWFSSYGAVKDGVPTGVSHTASTSINIVSHEYNGPDIWISLPVEEIGDGDGHPEPGEWAAYYFSISDRTGINNVSVFANGVKTDNITWITHTGVFQAGIAHVLIGEDGGKYTLKIKATDKDNFSSNLSLETQLPYYDYTRWLASDWNGMTAQFAAMEPNSSQLDGNWILLSSANNLRMPDININYKGPEAINTAFSVNSSQLPIIGKSFGGPMEFIVNSTPEKHVNVPSIVKSSCSDEKLYPVYTEGDSDTVTAYFQGKGVMAGHTFHVMLLNLTNVTAKINFTTTASIGPSLKNLTLQDFRDTLMVSGDFNADSCGDFTIDKSRFPQLALMKAGYYAIAVWDYSVPDVPNLVSIMPILVTKNAMSLNLIDSAPKPGDSLTFAEKQLGDASPTDNYTYVVAMVPEADYFVNINTTSDGTVTGTLWTIRGLSLNESIHVTTGESGTLIYLNGTAVHEVLTPSDLQNATVWKNILQTELNASDIAIGVKTVIGKDSGVVQVPTKTSMPTGDYVVFGVAFNRNNGDISAINQTRVKLN